MQQDDLSKTGHNLRGSGAEYDKPACGDYKQRGTYCRETAQEIHSQYLLNSVIGHLVWLQLQLPEVLKNSRQFKK